jgi:hypothetical protein
VTRTMSRRAPLAPNDHGEDEAARAIVVVGKVLSDATPAGP